MTNEAARAQGDVRLHMSVFGSILVAVIEEFAFPVVN